MVKTSCPQFRGHGLDPQPRNYVARHDQKEMKKKKKKIYIYIYTYTYYVYFKTFTFKEVEHDSPTS